MNLEDIRQVVTSLATWWQHSWNIDSSCQRGLVSSRLEASVRLFLVEANCLGNKSSFQEVAEGCGFY